MTAIADPVQAGVAKATELGYGPCIQNSVETVIRVAESDEAEGFRMWQRMFTSDPDSFAVIMAAVREEAAAQARRHAWEREMGTAKVLQDVAAERSRQVERYGLNATTPDGTGPKTAWLGPYTSDPAADIEQRLRDDYLDYAEDAPVTWVHLVREEVAEAFAEPDPAKLRAELVQVAALCVSWCERLDARQS